MCSKMVDWMVDIIVDMIEGHRKEMIRQVHDPVSAAEFRIRTVLAQLSSANHHHHHRQSAHVE